MPAPNSDTLRILKKFLPYRTKYQTKIYYSINIGGNYIRSDINLHLIFLLDGQFFVLFSVCSLKKKRREHEQIKKWDRYQKGMAAGVWKYLRIKRSSIIQILIVFQNAKLFNNSFINLKMPDILFYVNFSLSNVIIVGAVATERKPPTTPIQS